MRSKNLLYGFTITLLFILCLPFSIQAQGKVDDGFSKLPKDCQRELFSRIDMYVKAIRSERWGDVYEYYSNGFVNSVNGLNKATKDDYAQTKILSTKRKEPRLTDFSPLNVRLVSFENEGVTVVIVEGCGEYINLNNVNPAMKVFSAVEAIFENNTWFFTDIAPSRCLDCPLQPCKDDKPDKVNGSVARTASRL